ncbi:hypothetical protein [Flavobacterium quisquiliarum]|uniref:Uncharacterized protein n=1 Tax=Flavobacterium quisquiliarum TaxID=1834436 RepID=A0ABV8W5L3_9FLAO|nr:hypothetical protein [Flavobacterium quisquiliarum]MBW1658418.1 hypothetical protein [Flavobacterium quisquiliarum]NWL02368.1 hypothetical protein [Flavobacterium collinsii]
MKFILDFTTDYGQFYINEKDEVGDTGSEGFWSNEAFNDKLAVEKGILGISIENSEGIVKCELEILDSKSLISDFSDFDHVVEANLEIKTGFVQINDCPFTILVLEEKVEIGNYRVRVYYSNLESAYSEDPKDFYRIEMWKDIFSDRHVLKRFENKF